MNVKEIGYPKTYEMETSRFFVKEREKSAAWQKDADLTPLKVFEVLFGNKFERIRQETQTYAQKRGRNKFTLPLFEVKCALGVLILKGFHRLVSSRSYCEQQQGILTKIVSHNIGRNTFYQIISCLHDAD